MDIYYYILITLIFFSSIELISNVHKGFKILFMFFLAAFLGFRYRVGNDYASYEYVYGLVKKYGEESYMEPLYGLLCEITPIFPYVNMIISFLSMYLLYKILVYYNVRYFFTALLVYYGAHFILYDIHLIRQGLSILLVVFAYRYFERGEYWIYILYGLLALGFHFSAIVPFILLILPKLKLNKYRRYLLVFSAFILYLALSLGRGFFFSLLSIIPLTARYASVYNNDEYAISYGFSLGLIFDILLFLYINYKSNGLDKKEALLLNIFAISVFISLAFNEFAVVLRIGYYFRVVNIFLFVILFKFIKPKFLIFLLACVYSYYYIDKSLTEGNGVKTLEYRDVFTESIL